MDLSALAQYSLCLLLSVVLVMLCDCKHQTYKISSCYNLFDWTHASELFICHEILCLMIKEMLPPVYGQNVKPLRLLISNRWHDIM